LGGLGPTRPVGDNALMSYPQEERRLVTVLFADLVGWDLQRAYFGRVSAEVERLDGVVEKFIGDAVVAIFGAPAEGAPTSDLLLAAPAESQWGSR
jgi:class 3 adenylate cyclase